MVQMWLAPLAPRAGRPITTTYLLFETVGSAHAEAPTQLARGRDHRRELGLRDRR